MKNSRILKNQEEAVQCLGVLKVFIRMVDDDIIDCLGILEVIENGNPDLVIFLDQEQSKIIGASNSQIIVQYDLEGNTEIGKIYFSKIQSYANIIAELVEYELKIRRN